MSLGRQTHFISNVLLVFLFVYYNSNYQLRCWHFPVFTAGPELVQCLQTWYLWGEASAEMLRCMRGGLNAMVETQFDQSCSLSTDVRPSVRVHQRASAVRLQAGPAERGHPGWVCWRSPGVQQLGGRSKGEYCSPSSERLIELLMTSTNELMCKKTKWNTDATTVFKASLASLPLAACSLVCGKSLSDLSVWLFWAWLVKDVIGQIYCFGWSLKKPVSWMLCSWWRRVAQSKRLEIP